ncbi:MAG: nitroreductase [Verrucomicrobiota bacterium]|nr:nitroreductase [Verrucomicrobiota bacterium]
MNPTEFLSLISRRHCQRAFTDAPVGRDVLEGVLLAAGQAPSGKNTQPWKVTVVSGAARDGLSAALCAAFDAGEKAAPDYEYSLLPSPAEWKERARTCGFSLFELKGIARDDVEARRAHGRENFTFFGAPVQLIFHLQAGSERGNFLDLGMFIQNVMLGLTAYGLGSCPQFSVAGYAAVVRESLGLGADRWVVAGMSVGWPYEAASVNTFVPERLPLADFVDWRDG